MGEVSNTPSVPQPREGLLMVFDHEGGYRGCIGVEAWEWLLTQDYSKLRDLSERLLEKECA